MTALWESDSFVDENTLSVNVNRLRRKLESAGVRDLIKPERAWGILWNKTPLRSFLRRQKKHRPAAGLPGAFALVFFLYRSANGRSALCAESVRRAAGTRSVHFFCPLSAQEPCTCRASFLCGNLGFLSSRTG